MERQSTASLPPEFYMPDPEPVPQPTYQPPMQIDGTMPVAATMHRKKDRNGKIQFNHGLFDGCCGGYWWKALCCPCMTYGGSRTRLTWLRTAARAHPEGGEEIGNDCGIFCLVNWIFGAGFVLETINRQQVRERYSIEGNVVKDCCTAFWCQPCEMTQIKSQLHNEEQALQLLGPNGEMFAFNPAGFL